ncbi:mechanosensitive ion channel family protein [uncultured Eubacterium sp.]|uniref:mechanosensitive ion channel family protein n=1 Tax=uncultured Eubacterium sp. TaxID=165185 RepID=UPI000E8A14A8|nr:mechanosensitive ion channel domain-containing protein [uncultured Eubacterium sp.]HAV91361.1 mechanosensitive ion channel protein [Eubacterium sp.]
MNQNMMLADATFSEAMVEKYMDKAIEFGISILIALVIFIIGKYVIKFILRFTKRLFDRSSIDDAVGNFINSLLRVILYGVLIIIICDKVGIQTTSFIALLTSAGLAIGLALQGSLANFAGGVLILIMKPFVLGDYIRTDLGEGEVINIDIFYTTLVTLENLKVKIPNGKLADVSITNVTGNDKRLIRIRVSIAYDSDIKLAREALTDLINSHKLVIDDEKNKVVVAELCDSHISLEVRAMTKIDDYWDAYFDINENIKNRLDSVGVVIPFNQLDVHLNQIGAKNNG